MIEIEQVTTDNNSTNNNLTFSYNDLKNVSIQVLTDTFNDAFSDYLVPLKLTTEVLSQKIQCENLKLDYSIGSFNGDELCSFILHGVNDDSNPTILYNGGTGVIIKYRGKGLIGKSYQEFLAKHKNNGIKKVILEVITTNVKAIKIYEKCNFKTIRTIDCFKGDISGATELIEKRMNKEITISEFNSQSVDWNQLSEFHDMVPSWTNSIHSIKREGDNTLNLIATLNSGDDNQKPIVVGYIVIHRITCRIRSLAVHKEYRRKGIASALLHRVSKQLNNSTITIINIDSNNIEMPSFLKSCGLIHNISQYEMELTL
eukprot:gene2567-3180_t